MQMIALMTHWRGAAGGAAGTSGAGGRAAEIQRAGGLEDLFHASSEIKETLLQAGLTPERWK